MLQPNDEFLFTRQRHEADVMGLHYDLRLVHGDKAYSFATLKDMPKPGEIIAVYEQPVHDRTYALSEKVVIPKGQYGAGVTTLDWVRKAIVAPHSTPERLTIFTKDGEKFLLKKSPTKENDKSWIFRNITGMGTSENPYLKKVEEMQKEAAEKEKHNARNAAIGAVGVGAVAGSTQKVLGYHNVYHGTTKDIASKIKQEGFDPKMGGTGAAGLREGTARQSAGKVHVTKNRLLARLYGSKIMHRGAASMSAEAKANSSFDNSAKGIFKDFRNSETLKVRVPHASWKGFDGDPDHSFGAKDDPKNEMFKSTAATTKKKINSSFIAGGKGSKGILGFVHKNHLKNYYRSVDGRKRGLAGIAQMALGAAATGIAGKKIVDDNK